MKLNEYLKKNGISQRQFGISVGVSQGMVSHVITGRAKPTGENILLWCELTRWSVTPHEINPDAYPNPTDGLPVEDQANTQTEQRADS